MKLAPKDPPGRRTRRARGFAADIGQLRAQGYTFEAIRQALAEAGVKVSKSTVQREMARLATTSSSSGSVAVTEPSLPVSVAASAPSPVATSVVTDLRSGKEIAEAFACTRITNPLFRAMHIEKDLP
jgi:hypothetical protein